MQDSAYYPAGPSKSCAPRTIQIYEGKDGKGKLLFAFLATLCYILDIGDSVENEIVAPNEDDSEVTKIVEYARRTILEAAGDAADRLIMEMDEGKNSSDRINAAQTILKEAGVIGKGEQEESNLPSEAILKLIEGVAKAFGVSNEDIKATRAKKVEEYEEAEYEALDD